MLPEQINKLHCGKLATCTTFCFFLFVFLIDKHTHTKFLGQRLCGPGWPGICNVDQIGLKCAQMLGLKACTITPYGQVKFLWIYVLTNMDRQHNQAN